MRFELSVPAELDKARIENVPLLLPIGVIEYHSSHLPIGTDAIIAYEFAKRLEKETEVIVAPPVWYGPASYAVSGPERYSIDMDSMVFSDTMYQLFMALLRAGWRNICAIIAHQTEDFNPTETACLHASRTALFKYLEDTQGVGWWGRPESSTFYKTLSAAENPWNWIKIYPLSLRNREVDGDHAGKMETSMMLILCPESVKTEMIGKTQNDWFTESSVEATKAYGDEQISQLIKLWLNELKKRAISD